MSKSNRPVRVVHIITRLILGGAQENTLLTVEGLQAKKDYEVYLISGPALGPEGELVNRARKNKVNLIVVPEMLRNIYPLKDFRTLVKLYRLIQILKPDIVHTHSSKAGILGRLAARWAGVKIILHTIHGLPFHPYQSRWVNLFFIWLERWAAKWSSKIICVADAMRRQALAAGVGKSGQFVTIRSGIELKRFAYVQESGHLMKSHYGIKEDEKVIGVISRLAPLKGYEYILQVAPRILGRFPEARFLLVGDGILKTQLKQAAQKKGILDRIIFTGLIEPERIPDLINLMDILVHPSLREGLARTLPEALALGKPVVSFDIDGAREIVCDQETGFLVPAQDAAQLSQAILALLENPEKARMMGGKGRKLVLAEFDSDKMVEHIHWLYQNLLASL